MLSFLEVAGGEKEELFIQMWEKICKPPQGEEAPFTVPIDSPCLVAPILIDIIKGFCCCAEFDPGVSC